MPYAIKSTDTSLTTESDNIDDATVKTLREIVDERYKMSFDRSRLTSASDLHREAKRLLGIETNYA
jgi:hypothetical protein